MRKQPERFNFSMIEEAIERLGPKEASTVFNSHFGMINGQDSRLFQYMLGKGVSLLIDDYCIGLVVEGEIHSHINLIERHVKAGAIVSIGPGTIVQPVDISPNLCIKGIALFDGLPFAAGRRPALSNGTVRDFIQEIAPEQQALVESIIDTLWMAARTEPFCREVFDMLTAALIEQYNHIYNIQAQEQTPASHATEVFNRFIQLVNEHAGRQHQLDFYADKLCLSTRYLGTLIRQASGTTAKEWIDRALITEAKVMLKHTDKSAAQIAYQLSFPNPSFFSKYFRRLTGMTPAEYRGK
ncbi:MAG: AraC family transcriptional regulator [Prevotella sp.]|nr:AraC family transcriptional regulator [Prevotella sp.]